MTSFTINVGCALARLSDLLSQEGGQLVRDVVVKHPVSRLLEFCEHRGHLDTAPDIPDGALDQIAAAYNDFIEHDNENAITLATFHKAKGADRHDVMILGADELPSLRADALSWETEQAWNLAYVVGTRAKNSLTLVSERSLEEITAEWRSIAISLNELQRLGTNT